MRHRKNKKARTDYRSLEPRMLLAGDVTVFQQPESNTVFIRGDAANNQVQIVAEDGDVVVRGTGDTMINGQAEVVLQSSNATVQQLDLNLGRGDDSLFVQGVTVTDRAILYGGPGNDNFGVYQVETGGDLVLQTFTGDDNVSVDTATIGGRLVAFPLGGDNTLGIDNTEVTGRTLIRTTTGNDRIAVDESIHSDRVYAFTGSGDDFVGLRDTTLSSFSGILTLAGADEVFLVDSAITDGAFASGGGGDDTISILNTNLGEGTSAVRFENSIAQDSPVFDQVFDDLIVSGSRLGTIAELARLTPDLSTLNGALEATGLNEAVAGDGPLTVFAPLNSAFDKIADVVAGLTTEQLTDVLLFHVAGEEINSTLLASRESIDTLLGQSFTVDASNGVILNGNALLAAVDIQAKNGIVHILQDVLVPVL